MGSISVGHFLRNSLVMIAVMLVVVATIAACGGGETFQGDPRIDPHETGSNLEPTSEPENVQLPDRMHGSRKYGIWPQVWSQHAPEVSSWEYKVNCDQADSHEDPCFLSDLTTVSVATPSGEIIELEKDFNTNAFSGEVTRRWVLYGPSDGELPEKGEYVFSYRRDAELVYEHVVSYDSEVISYPTNMQWKRVGNDIEVDWTPPPEAAKGMHYKALIWQVEDTPELFVSNEFDWDASTAVLHDVPMIEGGKYSLNVAIFFDDGYAYSDYVIFEWPELGSAG